jgi:hypothetical protein
MLRLLNFATTHAAKSHFGLLIPPDGPATR